MKVNSVHRILVLFLALAGLGLNAAGQTKVGTTAAQFLAISVGPRAIAMGSAYVASGEDVSSLYWNPGAVAQAGRNEFTFTDATWLVGTKFRWFGGMITIGEENTVGVSLTQVDYGDQEITTVQSPDGTGSRWSAQDLAVGLTYCRKLTDRFSIGGSAKYVSQTIWNESATNFTFDLGLLFVTDFSGLRIGMSISNFGGDLTLEGNDLLNKIDIDPQNAGGNKSLVGYRKTDPWPMPLLFRVGLAMDVVKTSSFRVIVAGDALRPSDNELSANFGAEIGWQDMVFVRGGYKSLFSQEPAFAKENQQEGLALGAGVRYAVEGFAAFQLDYAYSRFGLFGDIHTIGVSIGY